jgi:hypothetical protein
MQDLSPPDTLLAIAEIAVAFAGFASLSTIFGRQLSGQSLEVAAGRLAILLFLSLSTLALAFTPLILMSFDFANELIWKYSAIFAIPLAIGAMPFYVKRVSRMRKLPDFNHSVSLLMLLMVVVFFSSMLIGAFGVVSSFGVYLMGLVSLLFMGGLMFTLVVLTVLAHPASGD